MKSKQLFLCIVSLLFTGLLSAEVYADQSSQTMGSHNKNSPQINGDGNVVCGDSATCNFYNPKVPQTTIQTPPSSITIESQIPTQLKNQFSLDKCENPNISNEDKHILDCSGY